MCVHFFLDSYITYREILKCKSSEFKFSCGLKQSGFYSATLITIYIDELFDILNRSRYGCHIDNTYMGALGYIDDVTIIALSLHGL